jgi:hypothetical protein
MTNENMMLYASIFIVMLVASLYLLFWYRDTQNLKKTAASSPTVKPQNEASLPLRLQAYERLVLLTERISLPNLITRLPAGDLTVRQYQIVLAEQIKAEYDHNITQQIYVEPASWQALQKLREQNLFIINQLAQILPSDGKGTELARSIAELLNREPNASLHPKVLEALNYEAKKLM